MPRETRRKLLLEPFGILEAVVRDRDATTFDTFSGAGCMTTIFVPLLAWAILASRAFPLAGSVALGLFSVGTVFTIIQFALGRGRQARAFALPILARTLARLDPTENEIEAWFMTCKARKWAIGSALSSSMVLAALSRVPR